MVFLKWTYFAVGGTICLFFAVFALTSVAEKRTRALAASLVSLVVAGGLWFGWFAFLSSNWLGLVVPLVLPVLFLLLFYLPFGASRSINSQVACERVDERDTMFVREEYFPGGTNYDHYYRMRPENRAIDDRLRELPGKLDPGGKFYNRDRSGEIAGVFARIRAMTPEVDGAVSPRRQAVDPETATADIKSRILERGAHQVGVARLNPMFVYSHVGRGPEEWGRPIENSHRYAIAFTLEMEYESVERAPDLPITEETARRYLDGARLSIAMARHIRSLGHSARAHISGSNYQIMLPPVAYDAGLGELGRHGYLISPRLGARFRLGAVTTDLPLVTDRPISFGVQDFCDRCLKCATNCPASAIPQGSVTNVRGVEKWPLNAEQCMRYWRLVGTDCGICMKVCPFSHPPTMVHNLVRAGIKRSPFARRISVWAEDLFYGRKAKYPAI